MTIHLLEIPNDPADWAAWLERYLSSDRLGELVRELILARNTDASPRAGMVLSEILNGGEVESVQRSGLKMLATTQVRDFIANPEALLELQEVFLQEGSGYWDSKFQTAELKQDVEKICLKVENDIAATTDTAALVNPASRAGGASSRRTLIGMIIATAAVLLGVMFWPSTVNVGSGRILGQAGLTMNDVDSSAAYFDRIADAGQTWFEERPASSQKLMILLSEVSADCQVLIDAQHDALSTSEREWFTTKCRNWKTKFDETLAGLSAGTISLPDAQAAADATMTKLVDVLRAGPAA